MPKKVNNPKSYRRWFDLPSNCFLKNGSWHVRYTSPLTGKSTTKILCRASEVSHEQILPLYRKFYSDNPNVAPPELFYTSTNLSEINDYSDLSLLINAYLNSVTAHKQSERTRKNDHYYLRKISEKGGQIKIGELKRYNIEKWLSNYPSLNTRNDLIKNLRKVLKWGYEMDYTDNQVFRKIKPYRIKTSKPDPALEDFRAFVRCRSVPINIRVANILSYMTGQRMTNVRLFTFDDFKGDLISFNIFKTDSPHKLRSNKRLIRIVKMLKRRNKSNYLIESEDGKPYTEDGLVHLHLREQRRCVKMGVIKKRYTFRSILNLHVNESGDIWEANLRRGHKTLAMTKEYKTRKEAMEVLDF